MAEERAAHVVRAGEGPMIDVVGDRCRFLATGKETNGRYVIFESTIMPGGGPPPHRHSREDEGFYVLEGELTIYTEGKRLVAGAGTFVNLPSGASHRFKNETDRPIRTLILAVPAGIEGLFEQAGRPVMSVDEPLRIPSPADIERIIQTAPEFGIEIPVAEEIS